MHSRDSSNVRNVVRITAGSTYHIISTILFHREIKDLVVDMRSCFHYLLPLTCIGSSTHVFSPSSHSASAVHTINLRCNRATTTSPLPPLRIPAKFLDTFSIQSGFNSVIQPNGRMFHAMQQAQAESAPTDHPEGGLIMGDV